MPINIHISGEAADEVLSLMAGLVGGAGREAIAKVSKPCPPELEDHVHEPAANEVEVDSAGVPFDPDVHTGTKLKDGTWRVKKGMADKAAELVTVAEEEPEGSSPFAEDAGTETANDADISSVNEDDEFAAFKAAADESEAVAATAEAPIREWTDADLSSLLNQAALKLGGPEKIKETIAAYVPEGAVAHSRHIPVDKREEFAQAIEKLADMEFAG